MRRGLSGLATIILAFALTTGVSVSTASAAGSESPEVIALAPDGPFTFDFSGVSASGSFTVAAYNDGIYAGTATWNADPVAGHPGDAMRAVDALADGWGIEAILQSPYRVATTAGHNAPYYSPWKSGDIPEGQSVRMRVAIFKGGATHLSSYYTGHA